MSWDEFRNGCHDSGGISDEIRQAVEAQMRTPKGKAEVDAFSKELLEQDKNARAYMDHVLTTSTTEGITRQDVEEAMAYLRMHNPKPEIPIEGTLNGHLIVALARKLRFIEGAMDTALVICKERRE
jgi:hypothetical protein